MPRKIATYIAPEETMAQFPVGLSGNTINGLGEKTRRRPSPFLWHMPHQSQLGRLREYVLANFFSFPETVKAFWEPDGGRGPEPTPIAPAVNLASSRELTALTKAFALENEADLVGITAVDPMHVYEGFSVPHPTVIMLGVAHTYDLLNAAPSTPYDLTAGCELGTQYARAARAAAKLANFIRDQGYPATEYLGPDADAIAFLPHAIAAGLGELGKHGSLINRQFGAGFRLAAITTTMPLDFDSPDIFGGDDFCLSCQICTDVCPPAAISDEKQWVRGVERWYVDFDKCIPYFNETIGCGICIAKCPWSRPGIAEGLAAKMAKRR
jgi:epoxyqueuosine reductase